MSRPHVWGRDILVIQRKPEKGIGFMLKKIGSLVVVVLILFASMTSTVFATGDSPAFSFVLSVDGKETKEVQTGDIITISLKLNRTDAADPYIMYAMQDEICYDGTFFELVEGSEALGAGIAATDIANVDRFREFYMNFLSMSGGTEWNAETLVGSFQLRVVAESGVTKISNEDFLVSLQDGSGSYPCEANELTIVLTTDCTVRFMTNGGSEIADQIVQYGEKITCPEPPVRDGFVFCGWYTDINLTDEWDFEQDVVQSNMSLYAKWTAAEHEQPALDIPAGNGIAMWWVGLIPVIALLIWFVRKNKLK